MLKLFSVAIFDIPLRILNGDMGKKNFTKIKNSSFQKGQSLIGILLAIAIGAIVFILGSQIIQTSLKAAEASRQKTLSFQLAQEAFEATKAISEEDWHTIDSATTGQEYYLDNSNGKWELSQSIGKKTITLGKDTYSRWIVFNNVSRDTNGSIEASYNASNKDPSTKKITADVTLNGIQKISWNYYLTRWENNISNQTDWSGDNGVEGPVTLFGPDYSSSSNVEAAANEIKLEQ